MIKGNKGKEFVEYSIIIIIYTGDNNPRNKVGVGYLRAGGYYNIML